MDGAADSFADPPERCVETSVFVIDPDLEERKRIETALAPSGASLVFFEDDAGLLAALPAAELTCLIASAEIHGTATLELVRELRRRGITTPVIVLGSHTAFRTAIDLARLEATEFLERPISVWELQRAVRRAREAGQ